jgi:hypothetical protein
MASVAQRKRARKMTPIGQGSGQHGYKVGWRNNLHSVGKQSGGSQHLGARTRDVRRDAPRRGSYDPYGGGYGYGGRGYY